MSIANTKRILRQWGRWAGGGAPQGFPMTSAFYRWSGRCTAVDHADPEVLFCDSIVRKADKEIRVILVRHYCGNGTGREKAARSGMSKSTYYQRLNEAEWWIHTELDKYEPEVEYILARVG